jgi:choline-sulfatase
VTLAACHPPRSRGGSRPCPAVVAWLVVTVVACLGGGSAADDPRPNVLLIAIDDLNDWVGHLGGHPSAHTPHIDALARRGTSFLNAHCNAPLCNPSRASLLLGLRPSSTGIHALDPSFRTVDALRQGVTLPQHFARHGYRTAAAGKIFHHGTSSWPPRVVTEPQAEPDFQVVGPAGGAGPRPPVKLVPPTPMGDHPLVDWGEWPTDDDDSAKGDVQVASWIAERIASAAADGPFFIAAGFFMPHVPCYATRRWFDLHPDDDTVLPPVLAGDRDDVPPFARFLHWQLPEPRLGWLERTGQWRNLVRSYLACTSFVDAQVGRVLDALETAGVAHSTIVVLWSDHGWHLGEKGITGKNSLWERSTRVPLVFAGPGITAGGRCRRPAELLDVFPTLVALAGLPAADGLEGCSLAPQLHDADSGRQRPAITTHNRGNHAIRSERWRFIRYADGSEELYDLQEDPREWRNLAGVPEHVAVLEEHRRWLPTLDVPAVAGSAGRLLTFDAASDTVTWEGRCVDRDAPWPE